MYWCQNIKNSFWWLKQHIRALKRKGVFIDNRQPLKECSSVSVPVIQTLPGYLRLLLLLMAPPPCSNCLNTYLNHFLEIKGAATWAGRRLVFSQLSFYFTHTHTHTPSISHPSFAHVYQQIFISDDVSSWHQHQTWLCESLWICSSPVFCSYQTCPELLIRSSVLYVISKKTQDCLWAQRSDCFTDSQSFICLVSRGGDRRISSVHFVFNPSVRSAN